MFKLELRGSGFVDQWDYLGVSSVVFGLQNGFGFDCPVGFLETKWLRGTGLPTGVDGCSNVVPTGPMIFLALPGSSQNDGARL